MLICAHSVYKDNKNYPEDDLSFDDFINLKIRTPISFDDGYKNVFNIKDRITDKDKSIFIFICPSFIENDFSIWWLELSNYIFNDKNRSLEYILNGKKFYYEMDDFNIRDKLYFNLCKIFKSINFKEQEDLLNMILGTNLRKNFSNRFLSWQMIKDLSRVKNIIIGSHTMSHINLLNEDSKNVRKQLVNSKKIIEEKIQKKCLHFSIPFGGQDSFNDLVLQTIHDVGYQYIYSTIPTFKKQGSNFKLIGRQNAKAKRNNIFILRGKYYVKALRNYLK